jgi:hypothetical protein
VATSYTHWRLHPAGISGRALPDTAPVAGALFRLPVARKDGRFIRQWGSTGSEPGQFNGVKALAIDAQGNVYAADLGNKRIQVFDADGTFKSQFGNVGMPTALCMTSGPTQYLYVSHVGDQSGMDDATILYRLRLSTNFSNFSFSRQISSINSASTTMRCLSVTVHGFV